MEDIKEYLEKKGALSAAFNIKGERCHMYVAVRERDEFKHILDDWDEIKQEDSELSYLFSYIEYLPRQEQIARIQQMIQERDGTPITESEEQRVAKIAEEHGASQVHYIKEGDKMTFLILGNIEEKAVKRFEEMDNEYKHVYMNPPRAKWGAEEGPVLGEEFRRVKEEGERLI